VTAAKKHGRKLELPTKTEHVDVACPICGARAQAKVVLVVVPVMGTCSWLQMPDGWAHVLPLNWLDCRRLANGLARCPACIPKPAEVK
jgi:hypothetical protein